jgi:hypothetical protein
MRRFSRPAGLVLLVVALTACGLSTDEQTAASALEGVIGAESAPESVQDSAECVATAWVGELGTKPLVQEGLLTRDLAARPRVVAALLAGQGTTSQAVADAYAAAYISCLDLDALSLDRKASGVSAEELDEYADCLKEIDDDVWRQAVSDQWTGNTGSSDETTLRRGLDACEAALR